MIQQSHSWAYIYAQYICWWLHQFTFFLHVCYIICICPTVLGYSVLFFSVFVLFAFGFWGFY